MGARHAAATRGEPTASAAPVHEAAPATAEAAALVALLIAALHFLETIMCPLTLNGREFLFSRTVFVSVAIAEKATASTESTTASEIALPAATPIAAQATEILVK